MTAFFQFQLLPIEANIPKKCATVPAFLMVQVIHFFYSKSMQLRSWFWDFKKKNVDLNFHHSIIPIPSDHSPTPSQESIQQST